MFAVHGTAHANLLLAASWMLPEPPVRRSTIAGSPGPDHMDEVIEGFTGKDGAECSSASHVLQAFACARSTRCCCAFYRHWCIWRMRMAVLGNHSSCNGLLRHDQRHAVLSCQSLCAKPPPLRPKAVVHHTCPRHGGECRNFGRVLKHAPRSVGVSTRLLCLLSHCGACTDCGELERHRGLGWLDDLPTEHRTSSASIRCAKPSQAKPSLQCCSAQAALRHNALLSGSGHNECMVSVVSVAQGNFSERFAFGFQVGVVFGSAVFLHEELNRCGMRVCQCIPA